MPANFADARDAILETFRATWEAQTPPVPKVQYEGVAPITPTPDAPWARIVVRHTTGSQTGLSDPSGVRRFTFVGTVTVQVFSPLGLQGGLQNGEDLAELVKSAFQGKVDTTDGSVWFRDVVIREVGTDTPWFQCNVIAEFTYDQFA